MDLSKAYEYCHQVTRKADTNFYLGFTFLPKDKRNAVYASYAFCRYADDIVDEMKGKGVEALILRWERDLDNAYVGKATHPIMVAMADAVKRYRIPKEPYKGLIAGCKMDLTIKRYRNFQELLQYCDLVATTIGKISLHIFGYKNPNAKKYARYLSIALQLTNILRDVGEDARKGRIYIPVDELERFGYSESELMRGVMNTQYYRLMKFQVGRAREYYRKAYEVTKLMSADSRFAAVMMGAVYARILDKIERQGYTVFEGETKLSEFEKKMLTLQMMVAPKYC
jgi:phytoene synthase